jgi:hypothetical protein
MIIFRVPSLIRKIIEQLVSDFFDLEEVTLEKKSNVWFHEK